MKAATFEEFAAAISDYNAAIREGSTPKAHRAEVQMRGMFIGLRNERDRLLDALEQLSRRTDSHFAGTYDWYEQELAHYVLAEVRGDST